MVNTVVLAGGRRGYYSDSLFYRNYGRIIPGEIKAIMKYKGKPLVSHVINVLRNSRTIDDIVVVGNKKLLEKSIGNNDVKILEQGSSILENAMIGYNHFNQQERALFLPCDIPEITSGIDEFVLKSKGDGDLCFALTTKTSLKKYERVFHRPYFWMINRNGDRDGYRAGNMIIGDPKKIGNISKIDEAYKLRKWKNPLNIISVLNEVGWIYLFKYFTKELCMEEVEKRFSEIFDCDFRLIEVSDSGACLDIDFIRDYRKFRKWHKLFRV